MKKKKVLIELSERCLSVLEGKAMRAKRSRKSYIELVVLIHASIVDEIANPFSLSDAKPKSKSPKK